MRLLNCLKVYHVQLHAYALLPNEAWLLLTPGMPKSMFSLLDFVNDCYSEYFNERFERNIAVFQNRPFLAIMDSAQLFLDCQKMIERWPFASGAVDHPGLPVQLTRSTPSRPPPFLRANAVDNTSGARTPLERYGLCRTFRSRPPAELEKGPAPGFPVKTPFERRTCHIELTHAGN